MSSTMSPKTWVLPSNIHGVAGGRKDPGMMQQTHEDNTWMFAGAIPRMRGWGSWSGALVGARTRM